MWGIYITQYSEINGLNWKVISSAKENERKVGYQGEKKVSLDDEEKMMALYRKNGL